MWRCLLQSQNTSKYLSPDPTGKPLCKCVKLGKIKGISRSRDEMLAAIPADCSEDSDQWYHPGAEAWASKSFLDSFFLRPADPEQYDPSSHPK